jgi:hypothetical protein
MGIDDDLLQEVSNSSLPAANSHSDEDGDVAGLVSTGDKRRHGEGEDESSTDSAATKKSKTLPSTSGSEVAPTASGTLGAPLQAIPLHSRPPLAPLRKRKNPFVTE